MKKLSVVLLGLTLSGVASADYLGLHNDPYLKQVREQAVKQKNDMRASILAEIDKRENIASSVCSRVNGIDVNVSTKAFLEENGETSYDSMIKNLNSQASMYDAVVMTGELSEEEMACSIAMKDFNASAALKLGEYTSKYRADITAKKIGNYVGGKKDKALAAYNRAVIIPVLDAHAYAVEKTANGIGHTVEFTQNRVQDLKEAKEAIGEYTDEKVENGKKNTNSIMGAIGRFFTETLQFDVEEEQAEENAEESAESQE